MAGLTHVVPSSNDNLTGVMISIAVLKCIKENNVTFENTEVCVMCGLGGSEAWAKEHKEKINEVPSTAVIVFDTLRDYE